MSLPSADRAADLVSRLSVDEKLGRGTTSTPLSNYATPLPSVGVGYYQWWSEALHGVAEPPGVCFDTIGSATSFPQVISTSMSFNRTLFASVASAISTEARAFANMNQSGFTFWTPNLNIFRDPRWGRGQETPGEDPYLTAEYVKVYVPGLQGRDDEDDDKDNEGGNDRLKVSACCKHYLGYSLEDWGGVDRHHFNAVLSAQDLADTYLPAFEACARPDQGGASSVMCSYNAVNGVPSCASEGGLKERVRGEWGFNGYVTSDCGAVEDVYDTHAFASDPVGAVVDVLSAGTDSDCGDWFAGYLAQGFDEGRVTESMLDEALTHLAETQIRLGLFDPKGDATSNPWGWLGEGDIDTDEHRQLALEAARQAITLLKNDPPQAAASASAIHDASTAATAAAAVPTLPLDSGSLGSLAVIGPNANATTTLQGNYFGVAPYLVSPLQGIEAYASSLTVAYAKGCDVNSSDTSGFAAAVEAAQEAEAVILVVGIDQSIESEGLDRTSLELPGAQPDLVEAVLDAAEGKPVVLVVVAGGAVCLGPWRDDPRVGAILFAGYPGQSGGTALAEAVFGDVNPSGRLTQTFYKGSFVDEISMFDMGMRPNATEDSPGRTYRFYEGESVVYPFGHGLSFTTFQVTLDQSKSVDINYKLSTFGMATRLEVQVSLTVQVANVGDKAGATSLLLFLTPPQASASGEGLPLRSLRGFEKVEVVPGEEAAVTFELSDADFSVPGQDGEVAVVAGDWTATVGSGDDAPSVVIPVLSPDDRRR